MGVLSGFSNRSAVILGIRILMLHSLSPVYENGFLIIQLFDFLDHLQKMD